MVLYICNFSIEFILNKLILRIANSLILFKGWLKQSYSKILPLFDIIYQLLDF